MTWLRLGGTHRTRDQRSRSGHGFSTISMGFLMLTMMLPIVFIGEGVLVSARQATSNALGQENLRAVDASLLNVMSEIRLDAPAAGKGCGSARADGSEDFYRPQLRPKQSQLDLWVLCTVESVDSEARILDFDVVIGSVTGPTLGMARVRFIDKLGTSEEPGAEMLVCDWQLGRDAGPLGLCD